MSNQIDLKKIMRDAGGYSPEAFGFLRQGLEHTVRYIHGQEAAENPPVDADDESRHVSGQELCMGLRDYAVTRYGLLARTVLNRWGIRRTEDFGNIVFAMVDAGLMRKTEEDRLEDFQGVYAFDEAFEAEFGMELEDSVGAAD